MAIYIEEISAFDLVKIFHLTPRTEHISKKPILAKIGDLADFGYFQQI